MLPLPPEQEGQGKVGLAMHYYAFEAQQMVEVSVPSAHDSFLPTILSRLLLHMGTSNLLLEKWKRIAAVVASLSLQSCRKKMEGEGEQLPSHHYSEDHQQGV